MLDDLGSKIQELSDEELQRELIDYRPPIVDDDGRFSRVGHKFVDCADKLGLFSDGTPNPDGAEDRDVAVAVLVAAIWTDQEEER